MWIHAKTLVQSDDEKVGFWQGHEFVQWVPCAVDVKLVGFAHGCTDNKSCIVHLKTGLTIRINMRVESFYQVLGSLN